VLSRHPTEGDLSRDSFVAQEWRGNNEVDMFTSSSLCRFSIQEADFGWGKPCLMHFVSRHNQYFGCMMQNVAMGIVCRWI